MPRPSGARRRGGGGLDGGGQTDADGQRTDLRAERRRRDKATTDPASKSNLMCDGPRKMSPLPSWYLIQISEGPRAYTGDPHLDLMENALMKML